MKDGTPDARGKRYDAGTHQWVDAAPEDQPAPQAPAGRRKSPPTEQPDSED